MHSDEDVGSEDSKVASRQDLAENWLVSDYKSRGYLAGG